jgi:hypothetical protein
MRRFVLTTTIAGAIFAAAALTEPAAATPRFDPIYECVLVRLSRRVHQLSAQSTGTRRFRVHNGAFSGAFR